MKNKKIWLPFVLLFIILNGFFIIGKNWLVKQGVDNDVLIIGNLILFIATILSVVIYLRSLKSSTGSSAVRGMYGSFMVKFFTCLVAAFAYIMIAKKDVNKPGLIGCLGLYVVYTVIEVTSLQKILRQKKNA
jgi:divalent metal cation (Fe/Co/Zn/Cd) transporter